MTFMPQWCAAMISGTEDMLTLSTPICLSHFPSVADSYVGPETMAWQPCGLTKSNPRAFAARTTHACISGSYALLVGMNRGPNASSLCPNSGFSPTRHGKAMWSMMQLTSPTLQSALRPPEAVVTIITFTPRHRITRVGMTTRDIGCPSYQWNLPRMHTVGTPSSRPNTSSPQWPGTVGSGNPGMSLYSNTRVSVSALERPERPEPQMMPTCGLTAMRGAKKAAAAL
mmetsp:Transcript_100864/g.262948  ORF Transcript_100864/g.262948 Transcript_100864/m.262948 type:complete len:227 (-) Transcript_100864:70-750(-)